LTFRIESIFRFVGITFCIAEEGCFVIEPLHNGKERFWTAVKGLAVTRVDIRKIQVECEC